MKLDVSDLFDYLYEVACFARARFDLSQSTEADSSTDEWLTFCDVLSNQLFLRACANRAFSLTHTQVPFAEIKVRIITERSPETGNQILFCRYLRPHFDGRPSFFAAPDIDQPQYAMTCTRPKHKLTLWLGKLPPSELQVTPPPYPSQLDVPIRYYARQRFGFISRSPQTSYYEFHGGWCLRQVNQQNALLSRSELGGQWRQIDDLTEISKDTFDTIWAAAQDEPAPEMQQNLD